MLPYVTVFLPLLPRLPLYRILSVAAVTVLPLSPFVLPLLSYFNRVLPYLYRCSRILMDVLTDVTVFFTAVPVFLWLLPYLYRCYLPGI